MTITIERGVIPPFAAPAGIATVDWIVSVEDDETGAIETVGAATTRAVAEAIADGYIAEATA